jgi:glycosyltransferase involved in cell wall biosynthesis
MVYKEEVDIILPIYNPDDKVFEAIDSVLFQTYAKWHLYIIDDASENNWVDKIREKYKPHISKITFFQFDQNKRAAACRNYAIKKGAGHFIAFIDQDDVWMSDKLEQQVNYFQNHDVDAVHGNVAFIDNNNKIIMQDQWEKENQSRCEVNWNKLSGEKFARQIFMCPNIRIISSMVKRDAFEKIGGFKDQFFGGEDETFWFEMALIGNIAYINKILFFRRLHKFNTVDRFKIERLEGYTAAILYLRKKHLFLKNGVYNDKFAVKLNALAKHCIKQRQYFKALAYIFRWFVYNPGYLFKLSIFKLFHARRAKKQKNHFNVFRKTSGTK